MSTPACIGRAVVRAVVIGSTACRAPGARRHAAARPSRNCRRSAAPPPPPACCRRLPADPSRARRRLRPPEASARPTPRPPATSRAAAETPRARSRSPPTCREPTRRRRRQRPPDEAAPAAEPAPGAAARTRQPSPTPPSRRFGSSCNAAASRSQPRRLRRAERGRQGAVRHGEALHGAGGPGASRTATSCSRARSPTRPPSSPPCCRADRAAAGYTRGSCATSRVGSVATAFRPALRRPSSCRDGCTRVALRLLH